MKKTMAIWALILMMAVLSGCASKAQFMRGDYISTTDTFPLQLRLMENQTFTFSVPYQSITPTSGIYSIEKDKLIASTTLGSKAIFKIDGQHLQYEQAKSTISENEYPNLQTLADGAVFIYTEPTEAP